jgi:hypothetical protein
MPSRTRITHALLQRRIAGLAAIVCAIPGKKFFEAVEPDGSDAAKPTAFSPEFLV